MSWLKLLTMLLVSSSLIACCKYIKAPEVPRLEGKCEDDIKTLMRQYILPDRKIKHCKG